MSSGGDEMEMQEVLILDPRHEKEVKRRIKELDECLGTKRDTDSLWQHQPELASERFVLRDLLAQCGVLNLYGHVGVLTEVLELVDTDPKHVENAFKLAKANFGMPDSSPKEDDNVRDTSRA